VRPLLALVLLVLAAPADTRAASVIRGPYLQVGTETGVIVRWRTDVATDSRVVVRAAAPARARTSPLVFGSGPVTTEHEVAVTGLSPSTRYHYTVGSTTETLAGADGSCTFVTSPPPGPEAATRIWAIGDSGTGNAGAMQVRDAYAAYPGAGDTDVWLMLGDNAYDSGTDAEYQTGLFDIYPEFLRRHFLWPARGNHDALYAGPDNDYYDIFTLPSAGEAGGVPSGTEAYYSFDRANIHFLCLDSMGSDRSVTGAMHVWMEEDLAAASADWIIAYWHHPPYSKGSHDSDSLTDSGGRLVQMRENFLPALEAAGVDLVLAGHTHDYERSYLIDGHYGLSSEFGPAFLRDGGDGDPAGDGAYAKATAGPAPHEGTVYVVAGNAGSAKPAPLDHPAMVTSLQILGSMVIDVDGLRLDAIHLDSQGNVVDRFTIEKGVPVGAGRTEGPSQLALTAAPNPFTGRVHLEYMLPEPGRASLAIYDVSGRRVADLSPGPAAAGAFTAEWDGLGADGTPVAPGVYFAVLELGGESRARRLVRTR